MTNPNDADVKAVDVTAAGSESLYEHLVPTTTAKTITGAQEGEKVEELLRGGQY